MFKRIFDIIMSSLGLICLLPMFLIIGILIRFESNGPFFYRGIRTGQFGRAFQIYKFRTMISNAEKVGGPSTALNDQRITRIGKYLRKYKIDELPQLINILIGDMSFVGPRPQVERYTRLYTEEERVILTVKPGLTDYASIRFINLDAILGDDNVDDKYLREIEPEKNKLRILYAKNPSFWTDMKILFSTFVQIFRIPSLWNTKN